MPTSKRGRARVLPRNEMLFDRGKYVARRDTFHAVERRRTAVRQDGVDETRVSERHACAEQAESRRADRGGYVQQAGIRPDVEIGLRQQRHRRTDRQTAFINGRRTSSPVNEGFRARKVAGAAGEDDSARSA